MEVSKRLSQVSSDEDYVPATKLRKITPMTAERKRKQDKMLKQSKDVEDKENERKINQDDDDPKEEEKPKANPIGEVVKVSGEGKNRKTHFKQFKFNGNKFVLEDSVLLFAGVRTKPYVAIIKEIFRTEDGSMMIRVQWFYRPEEAKRESGLTWKSSDRRELFYSFHYDEQAAESVMHTCVVHFVSDHKQLPKRENLYGFIVTKVYDIDGMKLWKLTDKVYEDSNRQDIDLLVEKTMSQIRDLRDLESDNTSLKPETPGSGVGISSEHNSILHKFDSLTGAAHRDNCLGKLLEAIQLVCDIPENKQAGDKMLDADGSHLEQEAKDTNPENAEKLIWTDDSVPPVCALEQASHASLGSDYRKMRTLLKNTAILARRLLNGELESAKILNKSPTELKEGLTAEEIAKKELDDAERIQITNARCLRCSQVTVGLRDIIQAGHEDRYQLECIGCAHSWYASRDEVLKMLRRI